MHQRQIKLIRFLLSAEQAQYHVVHGVDNVLERFMPQFFSRLHVK